MGDAGSEPRTQVKTSLFTSTEEIQNGTVATAFRGSEGSQKRK